ncbi:MAG: class I SAM-dependent methyltransferase [Pyrinomonadaceae bacterium]|nr:class I SAM-dependent methyltransferase [Pyrinomonadaceae bacterium]
MRDRFYQAINENQGEFGLDLPIERTARLADYYEFVLQNNELLHLVAPAPVEEFVIRHVLESLLLLNFLPDGAVFADVGAGAGLPSIPCILARDDIRGILVEAKQKKAVFLSNAAEKLGIEDRLQIVPNRFEEIENAEVAFVTSRALDKFSEKLPKLMKTFGSAKFVFFGGGNLRAALERLKVPFEESKIPMSEQRYMFFVER